MRKHLAALAATLTLLGGIAAASSASATPAPAPVGTSTTDQDTAQNAAEANDTTDTAQAANAGASDSSNGTAAGDTSTAANTEQTTDMTPMPTYKSEAAFTSTWPTLPYICSGVSNHFYYGSAQNPTNRWFRQPGAMCLHSAVYRGVILAAIYYNPNGWWTLVRCVIHSTCVHKWYSACHTSSKTHFTTYGPMWVEDAYSNHLCSYGAPDYNGHVGGVTYTMSVYVSSDETHTVHWHILKNCLSCALTTLVSRP